MEIIILFIGLLILGVMALGAWGIFMFFRWAFFGDKIEARKMDAYRDSLSGRFDGSPTVVWDLPSWSSVPTKEQLITDADDYGYALDHVASGRYEQSVIFKKISAK